MASHAVYAALAAELSALLDDLARILPAVPFRPPDKKKYGHVAFDKKTRRFESNLTKAGPTLRAVFGALHDFVANGGGDDDVTAEVVCRVDGEWVLCRNEESREEFAVFAGDGAFAAVEEGTRKREDVLADMAFR